MRTNLHHGEFPSFALTWILVERSNHKTPASLRPSPLQRPERALKRRVLRLHPLQGFAAWLRKTGPAAAAPIFRRG
jgi:hypothetical protein